MFVQLTGSLGKLVSHFNTFSLSRALFKHRYRLRMYPGLETAHVCALKICGHSVLLDCVLKMIGEGLSGLFLLFKKSQLLVKCLFDVAYNQISSWSIENSSQPSGMAGKRAQAHKFFVRELALIADSIPKLYCITPYLREKRAEKRCLKSIEFAPSRHFHQTLPKFHYHCCSTPFPREKGLIYTVPLLARLLQH